MPPIYSDISVSASVTCTDPEILRRAIKQFKEAFELNNDCGGRHAWIEASMYLQEMENVYNRLVRDFNFRPLEEV
jgi:hypothetical protein